MLTLAVLGVFAGAGLILVLAATWLAKLCDLLADHTGIGRAWIGAVLLAGATSLPELATDVSAVRLGAVDLGGGDLFGSAMANMLILALIDLFASRLSQQRGVLRQAALDHVIVACLALSLTALAAGFVLLRSMPSLGGLSPGSVVLLLAYLAGTRAIYINSQNGAHPTAAAAPAPEPAPTRPAPRALGIWLRFATACLLILLAAPLFAHAAKRIAELSGLGTTFIGTLLVGFCTSLPELVASVAAVRLGSVDLAVGNLFGSNAFNMILFFAMDLADPSTPVFAVLSPSHALTALFSIVLMSLGMAAILFRTEPRFRLLAPSSTLMLLFYAVGMWMLYAHAARRS